MPGKPNDKLEYLKGLNEKDFPYLIADILAVHYKHNKVKVVDGTGDGKRDIFSIDIRGNEVITQCKYHYNFSTTSGTNETDEIIIALSKFDCYHGFFCTSGKLSPQGKREYLDNYKNFELNWLEGHEIVDIVLESPILRKIWFENEKIHLTNNKIAIPFILRTLPGNTNFSFEFTIASILSDNINLELQYKKLINPKQLNPLSRIDIRKSTMGLDNIFGYLITLTGNVLFNSIDDVKQELIDKIIDDNNTHSESCYIALRFGVPYIPEDRESYRSYKNEKMSFPINSETFIVQKGTVITENNFLIEVTPKWKLPNRIHMSQLSNFCFYNQELNIVLYIEYTCDADPELHPYVERQLEIRKIIWSKSLFVVGNNDLSEIFDSSPPDSIYDYGPNGKLACWEHPVPISYPADITEFERYLSHDEFETNKKKIIEIANHYNLNIVDWEIASKIVAINNEDPFPSKPQTTYRLIDIFEEYNTIPSPINPNNRTLTFESVWVISNHDDDKLDNKIDCLENLFNNMVYSNFFNFTIDKETTSSIYLRGTYSPTTISYLSTFDNIRQLEDQVKKAFEEVEKIIKNVFAETIRCTKSYWLSELGIFL